MPRDHDKACSRLERAWFRSGLDSTEARSRWVRWLANLTPENDLGIELCDQPVCGPPRNWTWPYTSGDDATMAAQAQTDPVAHARAQYDWLRLDLTGASHLTGFRGCDITRAWLDVTRGDQFGRLAGVALARSLFETGLEAFRVSSLLADTLKSAPTSPDTLILFGDGMWVHLFRYIGGEKTGYVSARDQTRNTLSNIKWLRGTTATQHLVESYDIASEYLHLGVSGKANDDLRRAEMMLLATGASGTLQSYQKFKIAAQAVASIADRTHDGPYGQVCGLGTDPNVPAVSAGPEPPRWSTGLGHQKPSP